MSAELNLHSLIMLCDLKINTKLIRRHWLMVFWFIFITLIKCLLDFMMTWMNANLPWDILLHYWMWGYWISSIIWADLASGSCGIYSASFFKMDERKEGRRITEQTRDTEHNLQGKIRLLWDSAQEGVLPFDEKLFCKWICSHQAWRISEPPLFHYCWLMLRIHWVCTQNQIKSYKAWADVFQQSLITVTDHA